MAAAKKEKQKNKNTELVIKLVKSTIGAKPNHKKCVQGLGLRKIGHSVTLDSNPCTLGMIRSVSYLLSVSTQAKKDS